MKNQRWKLIRYPAIDHTQLFDLKNDPYELNNLAADPSYHLVRTQMWSELERQQQLVGDTLSLQVNNPASMEYDLSDYDRQPDRHQPAYTRQKYFKNTTKPK